MAAIYAIGFPNGKLYVGRTKGKASRRLKDHLWDAKNGSQYAVHNAIRKYGPESLTLMTLVTGITKTQSKDLEIWWISWLDTFHGPGYNSTSGGEDGELSIEARRKHSEIIKRQMAALSPEAMARRVAGMRTAEAMAKSAKTRKRRMADPEVRRKMSKAHIGKKPTAETRRKLSEARRGKKCTTETRRKISEAQIGKKKKLTAEARQKMSEAKKGKKLTAKHCRKISEAQRRWWADPEARAKMSEAQKRRRARERAAATT